MRKIYLVNGSKCLTEPDFSLLTCFILHTYPHETKRVMAISWERPTIYANSDEKKTIDTVNFDQTATADSVRDCVRLIMGVLMRSPGHYLWTTPGVWPWLTQLTFQTQVHHSILQNQSQFSVSIKHKNYPTQYLKPFICPEQQFLREDASKFF